VIKHESQEFAHLLEIITKLRGPNGCPWDKKQTHASLREYLLEETYEVLDALDDGSQQKLCGELGDLLLQIVLHAQIASESGDFDINKVIRNICTKLEKRHPHIFGDIQVSTAEEVSHNWEQIKKTERHSEASILDSVPRQMPALAYSQEIQRRAAQFGFDWENTDGVIEKLVEEVKEYKETENQTEREEEFGDLLFTMVNVARRVKIDPEVALRLANHKFFARFSAMEKLCRERGLELNKISFDQQNQLWEEAKRLNSKSNSA
jgi:tetrapyrrole methylase family protein/MazG family protein